MENSKLRDLVKASNPVSSPSRLLPDDADFRALFTEITHRTGTPRPSTDLLEQPVERRRDMQTQEKPIQIVREPRTRRGRRQLVPILVGAIAVIVIAVGVVALTGNNEPVVIDPPTPTTVPATVPTTVPTTVPEASGPPVVAITATNDGYEGIPDVIEAGTRLQLVNASTDAFHAALVIRLLANDDRTLEELAALNVYDIVDPVGDNFKIGIEQALLGAAPGQEGYALPIGSPVVFSPGRYVVFDLFPVGLDPVEAEEQANCCPPTPEQLEGTIPYFQAGLIAEFTVEE